jgi:hypothetical protein
MMNMQLTFCKIPRDDLFSDDFGFKMCIYTDTQKKAILPLNVEQWLYKWKKNVQSLNILARP